MNKRCCRTAFPTLCTLVVLLGYTTTHAEQSAPISEATAAPTPEPIDFTIQRPAGVERAKLELRQVVAEEEQDSLKVSDPDGAEWSLSKEAILTEQDVTEAHVTLQADLVHYAVTLHFGEAAAARLKTATSSAYGMKLAILLNGQVLTVANVMSQLSDTAMLSGNYSRAEATRLAEQVAP